jgi:hypothetical protein
MLADVGGYRWIWAPAPQTSRAMPSGSQRQLTIQGGELDHPAHRARSAVDPKAIPITRLVTPRGCSLWTTGGNETTLPGLRFAREAEGFVERRRRAAPSARSACDRLVGRHAWIRQEHGVSSGRPRTAGAAVFEMSKARPLQALRATERRGRDSNPRHALTTCNGFRDKLLALSYPRYCGQF